MSDRKSIRDLLKTTFEDYEKRVEELREACLDEEDQEPLSEESLSIFKEFIDLFPFLARGALCADYEGHLRVNWADWGFAEALSDGRHRRVGAPVGEGSTVGIGFSPEGRMLKFVVILEGGEGGKGVAKAFSIALEDIKTFISLLTEEYETLIQRRED